MMNSDDSKVTKVSIALVIGVCCFMSAAMYKVGELKFHPPKELQALAVHTNTRTEPIGNRGQILDREGRILAISTVGHKLFVDPSLVVDTEELAFELSFKERDPIDKNLKKNIFETVQYWKKFIH